MTSLTQQFGYILKGFITNWGTMGQPVSCPVCWGEKGTDWKETFLKKCSFYEIL